MRKSVVVGGVVALLLVTGIGGGYWIKSQAEGEVRALLAKLSASGVKVSHGSIKTSLWSRAVSVEQLNLTASAEHSAAVAIGRIDVEGINPAGRGSAKRLVVHELSIRDAGAPAAAPMLQAPRVVLTDVTFAPYARDMASPDPLVRAVAAFAGVNARTVEAPSMTAAVGMPQPAPPRPAQLAKPTPTQPLRMTYALSDVKLEGVNDGRVARAQIGKIAIGGEAGAPILSATVDGTEMTDLDVLPMFEMGLDRRRPSGPMYKLQGKTSVGTYTIKLADGMQMSIGRMTGDGYWLDPNKVSYGRIMALLKQAETLGARPTPQQQTAFVSTISTFYDGMRIDAAIMEDFKLKAAGPALVDMTLARLAMLGFDAGKLGEFRLEGLDGRVPGRAGKSEPFKIGLFALEKFDVSGMIKLALAAASAGPSAKADDMLSRVLPLLAGIEFNGFEFQDPQSGQTARLDTSKLTWGTFVGGIPTDVKLAFRAHMPISATSPQMAILLQNGIRALELACDAALRYDAQALQMKLEPFVLAAGPLGTLSGKATLVNVPRALFTTNAQHAQAAAQTIDLGEVDLNIADGGIVTLMRRIAGPNFGDTIVASLRGAGAADPSSPIDAVYAHLQQFLSTAGQTLMLRVKPKTVARLADIAAMAASSGPTGLMSALDVVSAIKK